jgi:hypothetical protein
MLGKYAIDMKNVFKSSTRKLFDNVTVTKPVRDGLDLSYIGGDRAKRHILYIGGRRGRKSRKIE